MNGYALLNGVLTTTYLADIDAIKLWEANLRADGPMQSVAQEMQIEAWVGQADAVIRGARLTAVLLDPISDDGDSTARDA